MSQSKIKYDIITPTFGNEEFTCKLLESIVAAKTRDYRFIWVDNASTKASTDKVQKTLDKLSIPHVRLDLPENLGFVKATNAGLAVSTAPFVVFQNNDTLAERDWLDKMADVFHREKAAGIVGPTCIVGLGKQNRELLAKRSPETLQRPYTEMSGMVAFFCAMIKRETIEQVGYLSEEYGLGFGDDDDYCARARSQGFRVYIRGDVTITHYHRTTFKKAIKNYEELRAKNIAHFIDKWGGLTPKITVRPRKDHRSWIVKNRDGVTKVLYDEIQLAAYLGRGFVITDQMS